MLTQAFNRNRKKYRGASARVVKKSSPLQEQIAVLKKVVLVVLLCSVLLLIGMNSKTLLNDINQQRIEFVAIEGSLNHVTENDIKTAVFDFINRSMVAVDLPAIKDALEDYAWIKTVSLRRKWPDTLIIDVTEEVAIARWGEHQLLNQEGALFSPPSIAAQVNLAELSGPDGTEKRVMQQYQVFNQLLFSKNLRIASLNLNSRGAWSLQLNNDVEVAVGSIQPVERLRRFASVYEGLFAADIENIERFDLRYEDGIAVKHKTSANDALLSMQG
jgi:cell division protein FtsQ